MKKSINGLVFLLPIFIHDLILKLSGYRIVRYADTDWKTIKYSWEKDWPMPGHPLTNSGGES